jgi:hypothetical protein
MLVFIGDLHGGFEWLPSILEHVPRDATLIQVGDFGFWPYTYKLWDSIWEKLKFERPMYVIDGNHEYFPYFSGIRVPTEFWEGAIYVPRGTVLNIEGMKIGFMGGASSIDKVYRQPGLSWFSAEVITDADLARMDGVDHVDLLVTHAPPNSIVQGFFTKSTLLYYGHPATWIDPSAVAIETLWRRLGLPPLICGHMHRSLVVGTCRILDINELYMYPNYEKEFMQNGTKTGG